jgi:hypothetical protein
MVSDTRIAPNGRSVVGKTGYSEPWLRPASGRGCPSSSKGTTADGSSSTTATVDFVPLHEAAEATGP